MICYLHSLTNSKMACHTYVHFKVFLKVHIKNFYEFDSFYLFLTVRILYTCCLTVPPCLLRENSILVILDS